MIDHCKAFISCAHGLSLLVNYIYQTLLLMHMNPIIHEDFSALHIDLPILIILGTSCRKSMDIYSNVSSPSLDFVGAPSLSLLGSSFFGSSLIRRNTPEILPSLHNPLIPPEEEEKEAHKHISHDENPSNDARRIPISRQSSYGQAMVNGKFRVFQFIDEHYATRGLTCHCTQ